MNDPRKIVGDFYEELLMNLFGLKRADREVLGNVPDLIASDGSFFMEVKAGASYHGGVINKSQLQRFDDITNMRRFYAFFHHSINKDMRKRYPTEGKLRIALAEKFVSLYIFPFSLTKAHFERSKLIATPKHDDYVQLNRSTAERIYRDNPEEWGGAWT